MIFKYFTIGFVGLGFACIVSEDSLVSIIGGLLIFISTIFITTFIKNDMEGKQ